jgi:hypothetical protein
MLNAVMLAPPSASERKYAPGRAGKARDNILSLTFGCQRAEFPIVNVPTLLAYLSRRR